MEVLPRPVMKQNCSIPAARASSTAYWIKGLSTTGSISFADALVAGRKRVPRQATGRPAFLSGLRADTKVSWLELDALVTPRWRWPRRFPFGQKRHAARVGGKGQGRAVAGL